MAQRAGLRFDLDGGRLQCRGGSLFADMGHGREPFRLRPALHRRDAGRVAEGREPPDHLFEQHHRREPCVLDASEGRAFEGIADPRQCEGHPDHRECLRAQLRAEPAVQGRRARDDREQHHLQSGAARAALQPDGQRVGRDGAGQRADDGGRQRAARRAGYGGGHAVPDDRRSG